jgi:hypothetical protein
MTNNQQQQPQNKAPRRLMSVVEEDGIQDEPRVELEDRELWQKFHPLVNEMIITKSGRSVLHLWVSHAAAWF